MSAQAVEDVLIRHLLTLPGAWPILLPNGLGITGLRRYVVEAASTGQSGFGANVMTSVRREINVRVEAQEGKDTSLVRQHSELVAGHFPKGIVLEGLVEINDAPEIVSGFNAGGLYIIPVLIRGQGYF